MTSWMRPNRTSLDRKKYQRDMNRCMRKINKAIAQDWLWAGRFTVRQLESEFEIYSDHSGAVLKVVLECTDHKTGRTSKRVFDSYDIPWRINLWINECITEIFQVWNEKPNPNEQARLEGRFPG